VSNVVDGETHIQAFFTALDVRHLEQCVAALVALQSLAQTQPAYESWSSYLSGILANERDHDWAEAERIFSSLLETDLEIRLRGRVLLALGRAYDYQGRWAEAIGVYDASLPIFQQLNQPINQAKAWKQLAIAYRNGFARGDFGADVLQLATHYCQRALDILHSITPLEDVAWLTGSIWNTLGAIYMNQGQWDQAIACYEHDLDICRALDDRFGMGRSLGNLGEIYQKRGRDTWSEAFSAYQQALNLIREFDDPYEEAEALANLAFLHQEVGKSELALDYYGRAIELIENLRAGASSETARAGFFATTTDIYANTILLCVEAGRLRLAFDYVERARSRAFLDILGAGSFELSRASEAQPMTLSDVQAALAEDTLLLECFTTGLVEAREHGTINPGVQRHRFPPSRILLFAVTRNTIHVHDPPLAPDVLRPSQLNNAVERHFLEPTIRRTLYDRLIAPFADGLGDKQRLYIVPHGPLHYIPFQALVAPDGQTLLRENGPVLIFAPSASLLFRRRQTDPAQALDPCLALGYNGAGAHRLHFAEDEARSIVHVMGGQTLAGSAAKKTTLFEQAARYRYLHLSCHGDFDPDSPLESALHLAPGEALTALDVFNHLRLRCDLVTLSACESGLSRVRHGDELIGLVRAFMYAGAPALVCTLWQVDERSTRILMARFYQEIRAGVGFAAALKLAQLYLMNLTRRQALDTLVHIMADEILGRTEPIRTSTSSAHARNSTSEHTDGYLKGLVSSGPNTIPDSVLSGADDDRVFADPYYWAPFILIGQHGS
jgi:CHAT domain-containing protein/tetratricopeptide (TPR) repeat protein